MTSVCVTVIVEPSTSTLRSKVELCLISPISPFRPASSWEVGELQLTLMRVLPVSGVVMVGSLPA
jgi:hypothetical protein